MDSSNYIILLVFIYFCNGSVGEKQSVFITVFRNLIYSIYPKDNGISGQKNADLYYNPGDILLLTCSVTRDIYETRKDYHLSLSRGDTEIARTDIEYSIQNSEPIYLQDFEDRMEFKCEAVSNATTWTFSINLIRNKTENDHSSAKPTAFKTVLYSLGGFVAVSIVSLLCYSAIRSLRKKKSSEKNGFDDSPLEMKEITYAQLDLSKKKAKPPSIRSEDPLYSEIGFVNQSCDIQDNSNPTLPNINLDSCQIQNGSDSNIILQKNDCQTKEYDQIKLYANIRHGSSSDC